ncbi:MAG: dTDP-4-dehydrorhamnose reductase [Vicinamibacterales bacterium]
MTRSSTVLVTGADGQLADAIVRAFAGWHIVAHTRATMDITDSASVRRVVGEEAPDVIVNCAAFNDVDGAEDRPAEAFAVNAFALRSLARAADATGAALVHYGTDFVFDGAASVPYDESAPPSPRSAYAASKLVGEWFALEAARGYVLRVESLFGMPVAWKGRRGTLEKIVEGLEADRDVTVFTDRTVSPSYVEDVAAATRYLVERGGEPGLYHCVNSGSGTWHDVAADTARLLGVTPRLTPTTTDQVTLRASRPRFCALSNEKLRAAGFSMPTWQDAVRRWLATRRPSGAARSGLADKA